MMEESGYWFDPAFLQEVKTPIMPVPVAVAAPVWRDFFPQDRIAQGFDPKRSDRGKIVETGFVSRLKNLVAVFLSDTDSSALESAPDCERRPIHEYSVALSGPVESSEDYWCAEAE